MNKKNHVKKISALFLGIALTVGAVGCDNFILTDNEKDLAQTVATVNISGALANTNDANNEYASVAGEVGQIVKRLSTDISKRDLVAYFLSTGYQYVESYGYSYEDTFNLLMDGLVSREIMIQYAIAYYLKKDDTLSLAACNAYIESELAKVSAKEKSLLQAHPEVLTLKYFLTDGGKGEDAVTDDYDPLEDYERAVYQLKKSLNDSLDSLEAKYIKEKEEDEKETVTSRTLPTGAGTEKSDYYDKSGKYNVYTGRNTLDSCEGYEKVEGSTKSTRKKAYNAFLANLQGYNLIGAEDTSNVQYLSYYYVELASSLGQALINKYFEDLEEEIVDTLDANYVGGKFDELVQEQQKKYETDHTSFSTAMGSVSDTTPLLYGLDGFGYVYNILLPFSTSQETKYNRIKGNENLTQDDIYNERKKILNDVKGKDLRDTWISADEDETHATKKEDGKYYFFQDQLEESEKYDKLKQYAGTYPFNGTVDTTDADDWKIKADSVTIDEFISIFEKHINDTLNKGVKAKGDWNTDKYGENDFNVEYTTGKDVDYEKFVYYKGKVDLGEVTANDYFVEGTDIYKAVSAVNELMFAYSTDTGCLNTYYGYAVSPYGTNFVKEFEYAAQLAVKEVGTYVVCATDYGWHIVFASYVYNTNGAVLSAYNHAEATGENKKEGSISNLFYESLKANAFSNHSTQKQNNVLNRYNNDKSVTLFKDRYEDLLELDQ